VVGRVKAGSCQADWAASGEMRSAVVRRVVANARGWWRMWGSMTDGRVLGIGVGSFCF